MNKWIALVGGCALCISAVYAQTTRDLEPRPALSAKAQKRLMRGKKNASKVESEARTMATQEEMIARSKAIVRARQEAIRQANIRMKSPQYSDPTYFGHKRKPRIRKKGRRKWCEECGIKH